jgi:hypothetical protein
MGKKQKKKWIFMQKNGDKVVVFEFKGGYPIEEELAKKHLRKGVPYTVEKTIVGKWHTYVVLQEFPDLKFNSVFFEDAKENTFMSFLRKIFGAMLSKMLLFSSKKNWVNTQKRKTILYLRLWSFFIV